MYYILFKRFSTMLDKGLRKNIKKKRRDGMEKLENKLNEIVGELTMKYKK